MRDKRLMLMIIGMTLIIGLSLILLVSATTINTETADAGQLTGDYTHSGGSYTSTQADDSSYYYVGTGTKSTNVNAYIELNYSLTSLGILEGAITNLTFSAVYCHDGSSTGGSCGGDNAEGTADGTQNVEVYNYSSSAWVDIGDLRTDDNGNEVSGSWSVSSSWSDFVDSNNIVTVRYEMDWGTGAGGSEDAFLNLDYAVLNVTYHRPPNVTSLDLPADDGYSNSATVDFNFTVESDYGFTNCTLYGNWSGGWHANTTIYNITINNATTTNITVPSIAEGTYIWNVLCYDNATVVQSDWFDSNYTFIVDTTNPGITLNSPDNDTISQDSFKLLNITVTDNRDEIIVKIFGGNETGFYNNNSLLYKRTELANNTEVTYNWTAPVLNVTSDTVLLMHFDNEGADNTTFIEDETGINNGTKLTSGAPVWNESGKFGYALGFDGVDDTVTITDSNSLDLNQSFSISFWAYPTDLSNNQTFLAKGSSTTTNYFIDYKTTTEIEFGFYNGAWRSVAVDASTFTANQWNLITVTSNDTSNISTVYINGADKGSLQLNYDILANSNDLKIGSFPGYDQNYTGLIDELIIYNKTLTSSEVTNIYQLSDEDWYWRVDLNDTASNLNISETRVFTIGSIWSVSPTDLGSVGAALNVNVSVGTLTINNTHASRNVTINITSDYSGVVTYNTSMPFNLTGAGGNWTQVQINVTSPAAEGSTTINFNITATDYSGDDSVPASRIVPVILVATSSNPFLITAFETYPTTVSQNNTGISLKASVENKGQGHAGSVSMTFELPTGWSNASGALTQSLGIVTVNEQKNASITVDIAANATAGTATLYANISGQNSTGSDLTTDYLTIGSVNVTVNAISEGTGPSTTTTTGGGSTGGGGGGGAAGGGVTSAVFEKGIEIVRGADDVSFDIDITNKYRNSTLQELTLTLTGFLEQYISISPSKIDIINYDETKSFTVILKAPSYKSYEEHTLKAVIDGYLVTGATKKAYKETQNIKLIIQEVSREESNLSLSEAEKAVEEMKDAKFNIDEVSRLLEQAKSKLSENKNKEAQILSEKILSIKEKAFFVDNLISNILLALKNPRKMSLLTGNIAKEIVDENGEIISVNSVITGKAIFGGKSTEEVLQMAIAAFKRGDYDTAQERAKSAQVLLLLERKGNFGLFVYLNWHFLLFGAIIISFGGIIGYRRYQKSSITRKIEDMNKQEENLRDLMQSSQKNYFTGKISEGEHHRIMEQHQNKLAKLRKTRLSLRNKRIKMLKPQQIIEDLGTERLQVESETKKLQEGFYRDKKISENDYKTQFKILNERLAEIEGEKTTLELLKEKRPKEGKIKGTKQILERAVAKEGKEIKKESKRKEIIIKIKEKILGLFDRLKEKISSIKNNRREKKEKNIRIRKLSEIKEMPRPVRKSRNLKERIEIFKNKFNAGVSKVKEKTRNSFSFRDLLKLPRKIIRKIRRSDKKGVVLIDNKIIDILKEEASKMDCKGKWIKLNFKSKEEGENEN